MFKAAVKELLKIADSSSANNSNLITATSSIKEATNTLPFPSSIKCFYFEYNYVQAMG